MDLKTQLSKISNKALNDIKKAAQKGDTKELFINAKILEEAEMLRKRLEEIESSIVNLEKPKGSISKHDKEILPKVSKEIQSSKLKGKVRKRAFIEGLRVAGINLIQRSRSIYETADGASVRIATASELSNLPDRWFLGLPSGSCDIAVLLCEKESGEVLNFILSKEFFSTHKKNLSTSRGQVKFNIRLDGNSYLLLLPNSGNVSINEFLNDYTLLG